MRVLWFYDISPDKLGGLELFAARLAELYPGHQFTVVFNAVPSASVARHFAGKAEIAVEAVQTGFAAHSIRSLRALLKRARPDLVVYALGGIIRPLPWLGRLAGARVVYMDETSRTRAFRTAGVKGALQRLLVRPVSLVIAASEFTRETAVRERTFGCPAIAIPNGIDTGRNQTTGAAFRARYGVPADATLVTQCSWLVPEKGADLFLGAAARLVRPGLHFVIAGEGADRARYEEQARGLPVTFTGQIPDPMTEGLYAASDVFCLPSRWQECCGLVNLEAMSFAVPVVATRIGGIPEYVTDGECGLLIEPTVGDLADKLERLLDDPALRARLGQQAQRRVRERYTIDQMAHGYAAALGL